MEIQWSIDQIRQCAKIFKEQNGEFHHCLYGAIEMWPEHQDDIILYQLIFGVFADIDRIRRGEAPREHLGDNFCTKEWAEDAREAVKKELAE